MTRILDFTGRRFHYGVLLYGYLSLTAVIHPPIEPRWAASMLIISELNNLVTKSPAIDWCMFYCKDYITNRNIEVFFAGRRKKLKLNLQK
jgi:hypothetical protein